ncbi:hypothetical protein [Superficieibacter electus]|nr:hypothetical protein [Superficieibacter electus]
MSRTETHYYDENASEVTYEQQMKMWDGALLRQKKGNFGMRL